MALNYPGGYVTKSPPTPTSTSAPGIWTMDQALQYIKAGTWPTPPIGDPYFQYTNLLLGTGSTNGSNNNAFLDSSGNGLDPTRNGNTTQGSFSPFSQAAGYWSNYFSTNSISLTDSSNLLDLGGAAASVELFVYPTSAGVQVIFSKHGGSSSWSTSNGFEYQIQFVNNIFNFVYNSSGSPATITDNVTRSANAWYYIVVATNASNNISFYINGIRVATGTSAITKPSSRSAILLGNDLNNNYTVAYISNLRFVSGSNAINPASTTITVPTNALTAVTGTQLLTCQSNRFVDNSSNGFAITVNGDTAVVPFQPFGAPTSPYSTTNVGGSGYFDGTGDSLTRATSAPLQFGTGDLTVEFWVYGLASGRQDWFEMPGTNRIQFLFEGTNVGVYINNGFVVGAATTPVLNQWNHLAWTRSSGTNRVFLNGVQLGSNVSNSTNFSDNSVTVGTSVGGQDVRGYFSGVRLLKGTAQYTANFTPPTAPPTAITNTSLLLNFTNAAIFDNAAKNDMETVGNAQVSTSVTKFGNSVAFDGTGDRAFIANSSPNLSLANSEYTVEMWVYANSFSGTPYVVSSGSTGGTYWAMYFTTGGALGWGGNTGANQFTAGTVSTGTWTHIAVSQNGSSAKWYINGNNVLTKTATDINNASWVATNQLSIGSNFGSNDFNGYISDLRITKGIGRYPYSFTPPTRAFGTFYQAQTLTADPYFDYTTLLLPGSGTNLSNNNAFLDSSGNGFNPTRNGNTTQGTFSPFSQTGWSNYFDGASNSNSNYITIPNSADFSFGTGDFSVEIWINTSVTKAYQFICSQYFGPNEWYGWSFYLDSTGTKAAFTVFGGSNGLSVDLTGTSNVNNGQWNHLLAVRTGTTLSLFVNGSREATTTNSYNISATSDFLVAVQSGNARDWTGYMSNLRIIKGTTPYNAASTSITVPTTALTAVTNTKLLTFQDNRFVDSNTQVTAKTLSVYGTGTSVQAFSPFAPTDAYSAATNGGSGYFDGNGDYLSISNTGAQPQGTENWCVEMWVYLTTISTSTDTPWFEISSNGGIQIFTTSSGTILQLGIFGTGSITTYTLPSGVVNSWNHFVFTRSSNTFRIMHNGVLRANATNTSSLSTGTLNIFSRGASNYSTGYCGLTRVTRASIPTDYQTSSTTNGTSIYTVPTAPATTTSQGATSGDVELLLNFTNAGITDATAKNDLETVGNAQISNGAAKFGSTSMYFDGTGDYLITPSKAITSLEGDFTVEMWIYRTAGNNFFFTLGDSQLSTGFDLYIGNTGSNLRLYSNNGVAIDAALSGISFPATTWVHVALVRYNGTVKLYVSGSQAGSNWSSSASFSGIVYVGAEFYGGSITGTMNGYMQDLRVTKGIARYTQNFTPPTAAFQLL